jgi:hypothetical protein
MYRLSLDSDRSPVWPSPASAAGGAHTCSIVRAQAKLVVICMRLDGHASAISRPHALVNDHCLEGARIIPIRRRPRSGMADTVVAFEMIGIEFSDVSMAELINSYDALSNSRTGRKNRLPSGCPRIGRASLSVVTFVPWI